MKRSLWAVLFALPAVALAADAPKREPVKTVIEVTWVLEEKNAPNLVITAKGLVPTAGWTDVTLAPRKADPLPKDGVYEFDLTAVPPEGVAAQAITPVMAKYRWEKFPAGVKGLKVRGVGPGVKTVRFDDKK